jgi:hypothetical protein
VPSISALRRAGDAERSAFVRAVADDLCEQIRLGQVDEPRARQLAAGLRFQASLLLPTHMDIYDRIYQARFERLIEQFLRTS